MELSPEEYDPETGLPLDKGYLECDLPPYVQEAIDQMQKTWARIGTGATCKAISIVPKSTARSVLNKPGI